MLTPMRGLRSFCVAAKCLSFKQSALQLYLTPSAVSHQIKLLEQHLGFDLFIRKTRTLELTAQGAMFFRAIEPQLMGLEQTINEFKEKPHNQTIIIDMPEFFASELFTPRLREWTQLHPEINIVVETTKSGLQSATPADLSVVLANTKPTSGIAQQLFPLIYLPACNQDIHDEYAEQGFSALDKVPLILHKARPWSWHQWAQMMKIDKFDPSQIIQFDSMFGVARAAQQGMGVALVPMPISQSWFNQGALVSLFDEALVTNDRYFLVQHAHIGKLKSLDKFAEWILSQFVY